MVETTRGKRGSRVSRRRLTFHGETRLLLAFLVLGSVLVIADRYADYVWEFGPAIPVVDVHAGSVVLSLVLFGLAVATLRLEGVSLARIGLEPRLLVPATVLVGGYFLALNVAGIGIAIASGAPETLGYQWTVSPVGAVFTFAFMLVVAGLVEEVVFRGYLQNRLIALCPGDPRIRAIAGIVGASVLFSAYHVPRVLTDGPPGTMSGSGYLLLLFVNGIGFGLLYEFTQNLSVPIIVHAAGNMPGTAGILFFDVAGWPRWAMALYVVSYLGLIALAVLVYRRWAFETDAMPVWTERRTDGNDDTRGVSYDSH
ncbi:CPBP family intramembrane glutamic endopeptidase [Natrarchaeobius chitinivorans]|uniref:CPBP family intramembrane metalloprotease n=1 Tax=Natrarchaeobius chitinivorans TaxID=1679083 RepID=A0A3N6NFR2_NATCH|nr:type II CAAX endopeptidase family protein [Natrarchaeobius chitinivorans]RQG97822.1 CPBP family intramembrane metalloprotease [Natrarchaeobius chitinivorans]